MRVLETSEGFVFEGLDDTLYFAEFDLVEHSLTGPMWQVVELNRATDADGSYECAVYQDYATEAGREVGRRLRG